MVRLYGDVRVAEGNKIFSVVLNYIGILLLHLSTSGAVPVGAGDVACGKHRCFWGTAFGREVAAPQNQRTQLASFMSPGVTHRLLF